MATDRLDGRAAPGSFERHGRRVRWFHLATYVVTLPLVVTGWWITLGGEGRPSPIARSFGTGDVTVHLWLGRTLAVLVVLPLLIGRRGVATFLRETARVDRGDVTWWRRWPAAIFTGRFGRHEGRFDPGQRLANVAIVGGLLLLTVTGIWLSAVHGGPVFAVLDRIHKVTAIVVTVAIAGHLLLAFGVLPGYRGAWRAMHLGGRVPEDVGRRLWPAWLERERIAGLFAQGRFEREDDERDGDVSSGDGVSANRTAPSAPDPRASRGPGSSRAAG
jgi:formate dehydrogenase subunit gamma